MKKFLTTIALTAISAAMLTPAANARDITIMINGEKLNTEVAPVIENERTLVPLRAVSEALGCDVSWDGETKGITLCDGESLCFTWVGKDTVFKSSAASLESTAILDASPVIMNDYTMVPLRAISEMFGAEVGWDGSTYTATVNYEKRNVEEGVSKAYEVYEKSFNSLYNEYSAYAKGNAKTVNAEIQLENGGKIELELYSDIAPKTVSNFVKLANEKFYDGLVFHRVIKDFMIQGGGFDTDMNQKEADNVSGEFLQNGYFNMLPHERGVISMARATDLNSASSQFFIMHKKTASLDGQYAAFGKVISGMEYVDAIAETSTHSVTEKGMNDVPVENQIIKTIIIK